MVNKKFTEKELEIIKGIEDDIALLIYEEPTCDFEHVWNCAISEAMNCCFGYDNEDDDEEDDDELEEVNNEKV